MLTLARRIQARVAKLRAVRIPLLRASMAARYLEPTTGPLIGSPNGRFWFHNLPLPDGRIVRGANPDPNRERALWETCFGSDRNCLSGKRVLDIGANDGFFTVAALLCGAAHVHAINTGDLITGTYPENLRYAAHVWGVRPQITVGDFLELPTTAPRYDVILFFGVLYHLENVYAAFRHLDRLLAPGGTIYLETQLTRIESDLPVFEVASEAANSTVPQIRSTIHTRGNANTLLPNVAAIRTLAETYGLTLHEVPADAPYQRHCGPGLRHVVKLTRAGD